MSQYSGDSWGTPTQLQISAESTADTAMSMGHPFLSNDELTLYFVSDDPRGFGGKDIWKITRANKNAQWSAPVNLGADINTKYDELFPTVDVFGNLYFSTDARIGMGGLDIFKATPKEDGKWEVENMKSPINSPGNDFAIVFAPDGKRGFLSSDRTVGKGDDIFAFYQKPLNITLKGYVINEVNNAFITEADVELTASDGTLIRTKSDDKGSFNIKLKEGVDYMIICDKKTFLKATGSVSTKGVKEDGKVFETSLYLKPGVGNIKLKNIRYDFNDTTLREESKVALNDLIEILEINPTITIELRAHTDYRGSESANLRLSQGRANSVVAYLKQHGIKGDRLVAKGYGESEPVVVDELTAKMYPFLNVGDVLTERYITSLPNQEQQEICNELNRRTEFKVLSTNYGENYQKFGE